jgi:uncharacterized protein involved in exopolysaccharide biosynthesis
MDDEAEKESFDTDLADKNANIADLASKVALLAGDDSLEGKKRYAELSEELKKAQEELSKFLREHQREQAKEKLTEDRDAQIQEIEDAKETAETILKTKLEALEAEREAIKVHYASILDDEKRWQQKETKLSVAPG